MRTNVVIDDQLMASAMRIGGFRTKKEAIETALHLMNQIRSQQELRKLRGKVAWEGNLDEMRKD